MVKPGSQAQRQAQELLFHRKNGFDARTRNKTITSARIKTFPFLELALVLALHFFRENGTHEERTRNLSEIFFYQSTRSRFVCGHIKTVEAEKVFRNGATGPCYL